MTNSQLLWTRQVPFLRASVFTRWSGQNVPAHSVNMRQISRARLGLALCELAKALRQHGDLPLVDPQTPRKLIRWRVLHGKRKKWQALLKLRCWVVGPLSLARRPPPPPPRVAIRLLPETPPHQLHSNYHSSRPCARFSRANWKLHSGGRHGAAAGAYLGCNRFLWQPHDIGPAIINESVQMRTVAFCFYKTYISIDWVLSSLISSLQNYIWHITVSSIYCWCFLPSDKK